VLIYDDGNGRYRESGQCLCRPVDDSDISSIAVLAWHAFLLRSACEPLDGFRDIGVVLNAAVDLGSYFPGREYRHEATVTSGYLMPAASAIALDTIQRPFDGGLFRVRGMVVGIVYPRGV
jgi:hypothetical protein